MAEVVSKKGCDELQTGESRKNTFLWVPLPELVGATGFEAVPAEKAVIGLDTRCGPSIARVAHSN